MKTYGFTLIELMIVIVILGILAATAVPLYHSYINHAAITEAQTNLADIASKEERYFVLNKTYLQTETTLPTLPAANTRSPQTSNAQWTALTYPSSSAAGGIFGGPVYFRYHVSNSALPAAAPEEEPSSNISSYTVCARRNLENGLQVLGFSSSNRGAFLENPATCQQATGE